MVTGASRGLGRGIARGFGRLGAKVFVTGRTAADLDLAVTEITELGGTASAIVCDHSDDEQVADAFDKVAHVAGRLDILVNNATAVYAEDLARPGPFWEKPLRLADMIDVGLRSHYVAAFHAAKLMTRAGNGLIASISFYGAVTDFHGPAYGAAKAGTDKMMADMGAELAPSGVCAVSIWPGYILTDMVLALPIDQLPEDFREKLQHWEHPEFSAFVIDALYRDPRRSEKAGKTLIAAELGRHYGITDIDGKEPADYRETMGNPANDFVYPN